MTTRQTAHGLLWCSSSRCRSDCMPAFDSSSLICTLLGGGGTSWHSNWPMIHLPRNTGDVVVGCDVTVRNDPFVRKPPRCDVPVSVTFCMADPVMAGSW